MARKEGARDLFTTAIFSEFYVKSRVDPFFCIFFCSLSSSKWVQSVVLKVPTSLQSFWSGGKALKTPPDFRNPGRGAGLAFFKPPKDCLVQRQGVADDDSRVSICLSDFWKGVGSDLIVDDLLLPLFYCSLPAFHWLCQSSKGGKFQAKLVIWNSKVSVENEKLKSLN